MANKRVIVTGCLYLFVVVTMCATPPAQANELVQFFTDPAAWQDALQASGKVQKNFWNFQPDNINPGQGAALNDNLNIDTHGDDPDDPWGDLWPDEVDNLTFSANRNPQGTFQERGQDGLVYQKQVPPIDNSALLALFRADSFDIISGRPRGDNHTAIEMELVSVGSNGDPIFHVTVYDKADKELGKIMIDGSQGQKLFLGILTPDPVTIGRVDIWDQNLGNEGISAIGAYIPEPATLALLAFGGLALPRRRV